MGKKALSSTCTFIKKKSAEKKDRKIVIFLFLFLNFVSLLCRKPKVIMIIMLINLSKLLLCTTLKSFYAVKKVKQTKKKRNSLTANHTCIDLQFMILKCAALQKLFVIGPFLQFRYCNCCCCNVKPYKFVNADTYIHTILNLSQ